MRANSKRRLEHRYQLPEPLPVKILLRSLSRQGWGGVPGQLVDVSQKGMGVLVQERVALASACDIEVLWQNQSQVFHGEVCYARRTDEGIRLGILLDDRNNKGILEYVAEKGIRLAD